MDDTRIREEPPVNPDASIGRLDEDESDIRNPIDSILYRLLQPFIYNLKLFGFFPTLTSLGCRFNPWKGYTVLLTILVLSALVRTLISIGGFPRIELVSKLVLLISMVGLFLGVTLVYVMLALKEKHFGIFIRKFHTLRHSAKQLQYAHYLRVLAWVFIGMNIIYTSVCALMVWFILANYDAAIWISYPHTPGMTLASITLVALAVAAFYSTAVYILLIELCIIISFVLVKEFQEWNRHFRETISISGTFQGNLEKERLRFEELVDLMSSAEHLLSSTFAVMLAVNTPILCFACFSYLAGIMNTAEPEAIGLAMALMITLVTLVSVCTCGCMVNTAVSIAHAQPCTCY